MAIKPMKAKNAPIPMKIDVIIFSILVLLFIFNEDQFIKSLKDVKRETIGQDDNQNNYHLGPSL